MLIIFNPPLQPISTACVSLEPHPQGPDPRSTTSSSASKGDKKAGHPKNQATEKGSGTQLELKEEMGELEAVGHLDPVESICKHIGTYVYKHRVWSKPSPYTKELSILADTYVYTLKC